MEGNVDESRLLITGAHGQLGTALRQQYPKARAVSAKELDVSDAEAVAAYDWQNIDIILNAAAYTNVDGAETSEGRAIAWQVNAAGTRNLAAAAIQHSLTLIHISSEYVFDGSQDNHTETEPFTPLSVYGQSKAAGDIAASLAPKHYILRTSWVIGEGKNFVRTMLGLGAKGIAPTVVSDQIGRLTFTAELSRAIDHFLQTTPQFGIYNVSNGGEVASWAEVTRQIFADAGYKLTVADTTTAEYFANKPEAASRPLNSALDLGKLESTGFTPRDWRVDLAHYIEQEQAKEQV